MSTEAASAFDFFESSGSVKFIRLSVFRLYDFSTVAQHQLSSWRKAFA